MTDRMPPWREPASAGELADAADAAFDRARLAVANGDLDAALTQAQAGVDLVGRIAEMLADHTPRLTVVRP